MTSDTYQLGLQAKLAAPGLNQFGASLVQAEASANPQANVFLSPLSAYLALALVQIGAEGQTREAIGKLLGMGAETTQVAFEVAASTLMAYMRAQSGIEVAIANALWSTPDIPLDQQFIDRAKSLFGAEAQCTDFQKPEAVDIINGWVSDRTHGKISQIITKDALRNTSTLLANAIYFMGQWALQFDELQTADEDFHLASGQTKTVRMMRKDKLKHAFREGAAFEAAALEYTEPGFYLFAMLPKAGCTPEQALAEASVDKLSQPAPIELELKLPKFTLDYSNGLKQTLTKLGMGVAFEFPGAEFGLTGSPLFYLGEVLHKTRLEVHEKGTVAAAATVIKVMVGAGRPQPLEKKVLVFDRPFAVKIADTNTGAVLFEGVVYNP